MLGKPIDSEREQYKLAMAPTLRFVMPGLIKENNNFKIINYNNRL